MLRFLLAVVLCWLLLPTLLLAGYEWRSFDDDKDQISLWQDGRQLGNYRFSSRAYFPLRASGVWGEACPPPYPPPGADVSPAKVEPDGTVNFGLDLARMSPTGQHILNGKEVSKEALLQAIGKPRLPDDSKWLCLTIIGADAERKQVLSDLRSSPLLAPWKDRVKIQDYAPDHWAVRDAGFVTSGHPTIYCQTADGKVLHRQDDYRGAAALAEVLRQADPAYQPRQDPDLNKPLSHVPLALWIGGAILLLLLWKGEDK
jgi:hypothetical protein